MQTANKADENFKKLAAMFPNAVTETIDENGEVVRAIDKDVLMQEINTKVVDGNEERYQFTWPDKKKSVLLANAPINKTLRPVREDETVPTGEDSEGKPYCSTGSVDFDTTENLYIEGDNLEVLKLLQETYLGKIKMIYIDPPYNTGSDFVYEDDFAQSTDEYLTNSGQFDENGNRLVPNTESNGRFHMSLPTAMPKKAWNADSPRTWIMPKKYVCMQNCREDSIFLLQSETIPPTGQSLSTRER